jgi:hypothetical protein
MGKVFVSYRRDDTEYVSGYISAQFMNVFGKDNVFIDVDKIQGGSDYRVAIGNAIAESSIMLVIIGPRWLYASDIANGRRIDQPNDPVRLEVETALQRDIPILPILVQGTSMPVESELPAPIARLTYQHAFPVRSGRDFQRDMEIVISNIARITPLLSPIQPSSSPSPQQYPYQQSPYPFTQNHQARYLPCQDYL